MKIRFCIVLSILLISCDKNDQHKTLSEKYQVIQTLLTNTTNHKNHHAYLSDIDLLGPSTSSIGKSYSNYLSEILSEKDTFFIKQQLKESTTFKTDSLVFYGIEILKISDIQTNKSSRDSLWKSMRNKNINGFYSYSQPIFNTNQTLAFIRYGYFCGLNCGNGQELLLEKINGKWKIKTELLFWIN